MPLINKQPFKPNPIPDNLSPHDEVFYHELTNEIFTTHDAFFDRFLYCNSLIWTCSKTGKSGLTFKEALDSEEQSDKKKKKGKRAREEPATNGTGDGAEPVKKKKKKYPYDPKKYSMPVPEGIDPSLLTPTGKIDGRKLKSKKNQQLAEELLAKCQAAAAAAAEAQPKRGKQKKKVDDEEKKREEEAKKEEDAKRKALMQAELAKERELEAKRKKEAAALARQLERQKKEEERKKAAAFLTNWEKKCEDLERDDLKKLPQPIPLNCDIPERLFGDAIFILESLYNLHELYNFSSMFPDGISYDILEEILFEKQQEGPLGTLIQFLLRTILDTQPTGDGYGLDDDPSKIAATDTKQDSHKTIKAEHSENNENDADHDHETTNGLGIEVDDDEENEDKDVNMNDLIGAAIKAAQEVRLSLGKPVAEMEINSTTVTEVLKLHFLQSGSFPKGRTIYNGWYSSREDPGLWLCMQEPDLIKKLGEVTIYGLEIEERIKILQTLVYQLFTFIKTRNYIESASEQLTELRKKYRSEAAAFARWDRENCVKRMQPPKRKSEHNSNQGSDKVNGHLDQSNVKLEQNNGPSNPCSINGDAVDSECDSGLQNNHKESGSNNQHLKSCLKTNGTSSADDNDDLAHSRKKITFQTGIHGAIDENGSEECENEQADEKTHQNGCVEDSELAFEELERAYQQNQVDYEDYQRERAIRFEQLNETLLSLRESLRSNQSIYGVHPIGRDRAYRRYWLFQSMPGLFVEQDDECVGRCLSNPTPLESMYKKLFNKDNPLMHPNEADLIRSRTCEPTCPTESTMDTQASKEEPEDAQSKVSNEETSNANDPDNDDQAGSERLNGDAHEDQDDSHELEHGGFLYEMNFCTGDETTCAVHGQKRPTHPRWWFFHQPNSIDNLIESLNKRGHRESELHDVLAAESSLIKPHISKCPAHKLNKNILQHSGIRRSRRLRGPKRKGRRRVEYE